MYPATPISANVGPGTGLLIHAAFLRQMVGCRVPPPVAAGTLNSHQTHLPGPDLAGCHPQREPVIESTRSRPRPLSSFRPALRRTGTPGASSQTSATSRTPSVSRHSRITGMRPSTYLGAPSPSADALTPLATSS